MSKMKNYSEKYKLYCADLDVDIDDEDYGSRERLRKHNNAMYKLSKLYHEIESIEDKSFLFKLLQSDDSCVKINVAAHCLGLGVYVKDALAVLKKESKNKQNRLLAFNAKSCLEVYKKEGSLKF